MFRNKSYASKLKAMYVQVLDELVALSSDTDVVKQSQQYILQLESQDQIEELAGEIDCFFGRVAQALTLELGGVEVVVPPEPEVLASA